MVEEGGNKVLIAPEYGCTVGIILLTSIDGVYHHATSEAAVPVVQWLECWTNSPAPVQYSHNDLIQTVW